MMHAASPALNSASGVLVNLTTRPSRSPEELPAAMVFGSVNVGVLSEE